MASLGQTFMQGWEMQPWQLSVMRSCLGGQALQAKGMMFTRGFWKCFSDSSAERRSSLTGMVSPA